MYVPQCVQTNKFSLSNHYKIFTHSSLLYSILYYLVVLFRKFPHPITFVKQLITAGEKLCTRQMWFSDPDPLNAYFLKIVQYSS